MTTRNTQNNESFEHTSEQAARLVGQFVSMANSFGQSFRESINNAAESGDSASQNNRSEAIRNAGQRVRKMREAAGYSAADFAAALRSPSASADRISAFEDGLTSFPREWLARAAEVLKPDDPLAFYELFRDCYPDAERTPDTAESVTTRTEQLQAIFANDTDIDSLSEAQFDALRDLLEQHYIAAKKLLNAGR